METEVVLGNTSLDYQVTFHQTKESTLQLIRPTMGREVLSSEEWFDRELEWTISTFVV